ncbi:hypothetical protein LSCM1_04742 [Leishmania martiniquensis]|uniref:Palmitoyltransferase n=1 Tax=Leishmania martiniquensis TaxID=1580590 RepID=A0A836HDN2_9TRYP|nr:hypothetical protein LSCM1_04742 [Leishmania martiniquensis]
MDDWELLRYAIQRRKYVVALWLVFQKRWLITPLTSSARAVSWAVVALGVALITFTVVICTRNVVPVLTTPGAASYVLLQSLVVFVSFNIYVNFFCATVFSCKIGKAPAEYAYRCPHIANVAGAPHDDFNSSEESGDDGVEEDDGDRPAYPCTQEMRTLAWDAPSEKRALSSADKGVKAAGGRFGGAANASSPPRAPLLAAAGMTASPHPPLQKVDFAAVRFLPVFGANSSANNDSDITVPLRQETADVARCKGGVRSLLTCLINLTWSAGDFFRGRACHGLRQLHCPTAEASLETLFELEAIAGAAERYPPRMRAARVLDAPRRYCHHCRRLKAPREHHCTICNECVTKMDHHCPWINNCVDAGNQRYFVLFVWWLWVGTLLASAFMGYGLIRQSRSTRQLRQLRVQWKRSPNKEAVEAELRVFRLPYGPAGVLLTSRLTILALGLTIIVCLCMSLFLYLNRRLVLENTTAIESIHVDARRKRTYMLTAFTYRSPYDLGKWLNFVDLFSPARDPLVKMELEAETNSMTTISYPGGLAGGRGRRWVSVAKRLAQRLAIVVWLTSFPTFRPIYGNGVHYPTFDSLASGDPHPLLAA